MVVFSYRLQPYRFASLSEDQQLPLFFVSNRMQVRDTARLLTMDSAGGEMSGKEIPQPSRYLLPKGQHPSFRFPIPLVKGNRRYPHTWY